MKRYAFILLLIPFLFGCKSKDFVLLRLKYKPSEEQNYSISVKCDCHSELHYYTNTSVKFTMDSLIGNNEYSMFVQLTAMKVNVKIDGLMTPGVFSENYDSRQSPQSYRDMDENQREVSAKYDSILANTYTLSFDKRGNVLKPFAIGAKPVKAPFNAQIIQLPYPEGKVKVGDTWTTALQSPFGTTARFGSGRYTLTYTVGAIDNIRVKVDVVFAVEGDPNVRGSGTYNVNRATGHVEDGYINIPVPGCGDDALISIKDESLSSYK